MNSLRKQIQALSKKKEAKDPPIETDNIPATSYSDLDNLGSQQMNSDSQFPSQEDSSDVKEKHRLSQLTVHFYDGSARVFESEYLSDSYKAPWREFYSWCYGRAYTRLSPSRTLWKGNSTEEKSHCFDLRSSRLKCWR